MTLRAVPGGPPDPGMVSIAEAVDETIAALDPPAADAAVVALARLTASTIDAMAPGQRGMMLGQTAPQLLKLMQELQQRADKRRAASRSGRPGRMAQLRAAHAQSPAKRKRMG